MMTSDSVMTISELVASLDTTAKRLQFVLGWIGNNSDHWDQGQWHCGTSHCFAGICQLLKLGFDPATTSVIDVSEDEFKGRFATREGIRLGSPHEDAAEWLGIDDDLADRLFDWGNSYEDLCEVIDEYCEYFG